MVLNNMFKYITVVRSNMTSAVCVALLCSAGCDPVDTPNPVAMKSESVPITAPGSAPGESTPMAVPLEPVAKSVENVADAAKGEASELMFSVRMLSWNLESDGSDPEVIAQELKEMPAYDVYALSEVLPTAIETFNKALGSQYKGVMTQSGRNDRLAIYYDTTEFEEVKHFEIEEINFQRRYRAPLVVQLKHLSSGKEFMVMNNHLARGKAEVREKQSTQLVEWARTQLLPTVALGDYNFDYVFATAKGNGGFDNMLQDSVWQWVEPVELIDSNWYDNPESPDGEDDYPGSILDFAFVAGPAKAWKKSCKVIVRPGDFPDDERTSDHRPFELILSN